MGRTYRGSEKDYLKDKYLREQSKREKRKIKDEEESKGRSKEYTTNEVFSRR